MTAHRTLAARLGRAGIHAVVADFYDRARTDPQLAPAFAHVRDWAAVKARVAEFWWRDLGGAPDGPAVFNPHAVHRRFGVSAAQVDPWLAHFEAAVHAHVPADAAQVWTDRARRMAHAVRLELARPPPAL